MRTARKEKAGHSARLSCVFSSSLMLSMPPGAFQSLSAYKVNHKPAWSQPDSIQLSHRCTPALYREDQVALDLMATWLAQDRPVDHLWPVGPGSDAVPARVQGSSSITRESPHDVDRGRLLHPASFPYTRGASARHLFAARGPPGSQTQSAFSLEPQPASRPWDLDLPPTAWTRRPSKPGVRVDGPPQPATDLVNLGNLLRGRHVPAIVEPT